MKRKFLPACGLRIILYLLLTNEIHVVRIFGSGVGIGVARRAGAVDHVEWTGCYDESWKSVATEESFSHPAKYARGLIRRIYQHLRDEYGLPAGSIVVDPFGGVANGALDAMEMGYVWMGCELEERFVKIGQANIDHWKRFYPEAVAEIRQGDSRRLGEVLGPVLAGCVEAVVTSPDFVNCDTQPTKLGSGKGTRADGDGAGRNKGDYHYSTAEGKLGAMPPGDLAAAMKEGTLADCCVSSPPYEGSDVASACKSQNANGRQATYVRAMGCTGYGQTPGNIGNDTGQTFWQASAEILQQCYDILRPGGIAVFVCKDFIRKGERVPFSADWLKLCIATGFEPVEWIKASLVKQNRHPGLFGEDVVKQKERKSFFRRLHEKKRPDLKIDEEDVLIVRKPGATR